MCPSSSRHYTCTEQMLSRKVLDGESESHSVLLASRELFSGSVQASIVYFNSYIFVYILEKYNYCDSVAVIRIFF